MRVYQTTETRNSYGFYLKIQLIFHSRYMAFSVINANKGILFRKVLAVYYKHRNKHVQKTCGKNRVFVMLVSIAEC